MVTKIQTKAVERQESITIIDQRVDHANSMKVLADNGLRPLTYQEAFTRSSELITELKGKWFYLDGQGIEKSGIHTFNERGELVGLTGNESIDQKVRVWPGTNPLSLVVSDYGARYGGWRFGLSAGGAPGGVAPVVVGVKTGREAAPPQNGPEASTIPKQVVNDADRQLARLEKSSNINNDEIAALRELVDAAKGLKRQ